MCIYFGRIAASTAVLAVWRIDVWIPDEILPVAVYSTQQLCFSLITAIFLLAENSVPACQGDGR
jgi:hypothetical protein